MRFSQPLEALLEQLIGEVMHVEECLGSRV